MWPLQRLGVGVKSGRPKSEVWAWSVRLVYCSQLSWKLHNHTSQISSMFEIPCQDDSDESPSVANQKSRLGSINNQMLHTFYRMCIYSIYTFFSAMISPIFLHLPFPTLLNTTQARTSSWQCPLYLFFYWRHVWSCKYFCDPVSLELLP